MRYFVDYKASVKVLSCLRAAGTLPLPSAITRIAGEMRGERDRLAFDPSSLGIDASSANEIDFLIGARGGGRALCNVSHLGTRVPKGSFVQIHADTFVCSPGMCLVRMASNKQVSMGRLVAFAMELMGTYSTYAPSGMACFGVVPLVTKEELLRFIESACELHLRGSRRARTAARLALPDSASRMETCLSLVLSLPPRYGGLGLPVPVLNEEVRAKPEQRELIGRDTYKPDIYWQKCDLDVEYDGDQHNTREEILIDRSRQNDLVALGMTILRASYSDVRTSIALARFERRILAIMKKQGYRRASLYLERVNDLDFQADHARLLADLLPPARDPRI